MILGQLKIGEPQTKCDVVADANDVEIAAEDEFITFWNWRNYVILHVVMLGIDFITAVDVTKAGPLCLWRCFYHRMVVFCQYALPCQITKELFWIEISVTWNISPLNYIDWKTTIPHFYNLYFEMDCWAFLPNDQRSLWNLKSYLICLVFIWEHARTKVTLLIEWTTKLPRRETFM